MGFYDTSRNDAEKITAYDEDIRVPLLVRGPEVPAGVDRRHLGVNNDWAPTIADLAGVDTPGFVEDPTLTALHATPRRDQDLRRAAVPDRGEGRVLT